MIGTFYLSILVWFPLSWYASRVFEDVCAQTGQRRYVCLLFLLQYRSGRVGIPYYTYPLYSLVAHGESSWGQKKFGARLC